MRRLPLLCGRLLLLVLASTLTLAAAPPGSQSSLHGAAPDRPNFVFVMADDQVRSCRQWLMFACDRGFFVLA
eukprot:m.72007 g.72007  ORF g.72007 m.72007 type:complete len:72 (+) comp7975_c0_seq2:1186-1401(+)